MENFVFPVFILGLFLFIIFWIWAFLDLVSSPFKKTRWKVAWLLIIIAFPLLGAILYLLLGKEFKVQRSRRFQPQFRGERTLE
ncbi:PLDc N-terminal domain-containing protein [Salinimicrobium xinjiangense]|uniref:PLDc N-terminal domain-containing protein n=1 Tax=Salinimicrobium xinjiangense TaxID=438596 RepID=UPI00048BE36B|nr:PLDc N-terminal domain-containing protein [Salinimicrobium xinjiangense]